MVAYCVVNVTDSQVSNVNATIDIPKRSMRKGVVLDATELAAACANVALVVMKDAPTRAKLRAAAKIMQYRTKDVTGAAL